MKKYKVVLFNPETLRKRTYYFEFSWNGINHCWEIRIDNAERSQYYYGNPEEGMKHFIDCRKIGSHINDYVTIKKVA